MRALISKPIALEIDWLQYQMSFINLLKNETDYRGIILGLIMVPQSGRLMFQCQKSKLFTGMLSIFLWEWSQHVTVPEVGLTPTMFRGITRP